MKLAAAFVHLFTALGAVCALLALMAIADKSWEACFVWLGIAFLIDGMDGTFARWARVSEHLPRFSGERLDLVIDYLSYVFIPAYAVLASGILTGVTGRLLAAGILLSSLFHFSDTASKAEDNSFVGFPAVWNIVAFYLFVFTPSEDLARAIVAACILLTFAPMKWVHPMRIQRGLLPVMALCGLWSAAAIAAVWSGFGEVPLWSRIALLASAATMVGLSIYSTAGRPTR